MLMGKLLSRCLSLTTGGETTKACGELLIPRSFMLEKKATVRDVPWVQNMLPLQVYRGSRVEPVTKFYLHELDQCSLKGLSKSSEFLKEQYDQLSDEKRRQLKMKVEAEARASQPLNSEKHLHILYYDEHICVTCKPSGILSVPGPRRNPSLANLVHNTVKPTIDIDKMVIHRLDMDTSGIVVYALTEMALKTMHDDFRNRRVKKTYEALLCSHVSVSSEIEIDVGLERDPFHPPFMRIAQPKEESGDLSLVHPEFQKFINQAPKPSLTKLEVRSFEHLIGGDGQQLPVTRVELTPYTGRTHQLRVHASAIGFPIVGDDIYGWKGEGECSLLNRLDSSQNTVHKQIWELDLPLCLHARRLSFFHPLTGAPMMFECEPAF